jgi:hypothetical protein
MTGTGDGGGTDFAAMARATLARLGVEADDVQLAVMAAADGLYAPLIRALMEADLGAVAEETSPDMSRPPA